MFGSLLILLMIPFIDLSRTRGNRFNLAKKINFSIFVVVFFGMMWLGMEHANEPFTSLSAIGTVLYFSTLIIGIPLSSLVDNTLMDLAT